MIAFSALCIALAALVLRVAYKQAKRADDAPENDVDIRRRFNALEVQRAKRKAS